MSAAIESATDSESPLLTVRGLTTAFPAGGGELRVVDGVDLELRRGETFALVGESGCGKSMTAFSILRLLPAGARLDGEVRLDGADLLALPEAAMRRVRGRRIAMIFQEPMTSLNPVLTVGRQIQEVLERHLGLRGRVARERILELLAEVGIPDPGKRIDEYPHQLSGGMKQRVMIAMALAGEPELLIADEPTTALDVTIQAQVLRLLQRLQRERGMALLLITHDLGVVAQMADRVAVMYAGQVVEEARREDFLRHRRHPYTRRLFQALPEARRRGQPLATIPGSVPSRFDRIPGCRFAERCDIAQPLCRERAPELLPVAGQRVRCFAVDPRFAARFPSPPALDVATEAVPGSRQQAATPLLEVSGLKVHFPIRRGLLKREVGRVYAVDGVDMAIAAGRTLALVGESGCGKTTVGKAILQLIRPTAGSVRFDDTELTTLKGEALRRRRRELQLVFQDPFSSMNPRMRVEEIVAEGLIAQKMVRDRRERRERVAELLRQVGLRPEVMDRYPHEFSGGQRQRICIARALAVSPRLIVCDEPTSALDVSVQAQILNLLAELQREMGLAYLFITHNLSVVGYLAHEVAVMYLGRVVEQGPAEAVLADPRHPYTQALVSAVPRVEEGGREVIRLEGDPPSPIAPPPGCHFAPRCPRAEARCQEAYPPVTALGEGRWVRCFLYGD